jgi:hypothetical protein
MTQDRDVISVALALALHDAGLQWTPTRGDSFVMPGVEMDDVVFVLSDMTIEVNHFGPRTVIGFNGTTEWALDSVDQDDALWLPAEHQLRDLLGDAFTELARTPTGYRVTLTKGEDISTYDGADPTEAYALALLELLGGPRN